MHYFQGSTTPPPHTHTHAGRLRNRSFRRLLTFTLIHIDVPVRLAHFRRYALTFRNRMFQMSLRRGRGTPIVMHSLF